MGKMLAIPLRKMLQPPGLIKPGRLIGLYYFCIHNLGLHLLPLLCPSPFMDEPVHFGLTPATGHWMRAVLPLHVKIASQIPSLEERLHGKLTVQLACIAPL
jgi:hypothetical protein